MTIFTQDLEDLKAMIRGHQWLRLFTETYFCESGAESEQIKTGHKLQEEVMEILFYETHFWPAC